MTRFNLVHQPWIPVTAAGAPIEVSLLDALTRAHELDALGLGDPLQTVAVLRQVLLPVLLDACGAPRSNSDWSTRWAGGRLDAARIGDYLAEHAHRFDLFDPAAPFAQVAGLRTGKDETKSVAVLLPAVATGNSVPLFSTRTDADPPRLPPAEAARALLTSHCWDTAAIKSGAVGDPRMKAGKTTGNPTSPVGALGVVIPMGTTLAQTLLLNLPVHAQGLRPADRPQWRADPATAAWQDRAAIGLMDLLTFQSRRIRLISEPADPAGPARPGAVTPGDPEAVVVARVVLAAGDRLDHHPQIEPHTQWRQAKNPKAGEPPRTPVRLQPGKSAWRGLASLLATTAPTKDGLSSTLLLDQLAGMRLEGRIPPTLALQVLTVGVAYGNQMAVVDDVIVDLIPLPVLALTQDAPLRGLLDQVVTQAEALRHAGNDLGDDLRQAVGGDKLPWDKALRVGDALIAQLTPTVHRLLAGLQRDPDRLDAAEAAWTDTARRLALAAADEVLSAAGPQAFLGRQRPGTSVVHRQSTAEAAYRAAVYKTLPRTAASTDPSTPLGGATSSMPALAGGHE